MPHFGYENLKAYQMALAVARAIQPASFGHGHSNLRDQAVRSSQSMVLNIAEGAGLRGKAQKHHFRIALGSAAETCAVLDLVQLPKGPELQDALRQVGAMLGALTR